MAPWQSLLHEYALTPVHVPPASRGKNATDMKLAIEAMDLLHQKSLQGICIASSDSDFTTLASRIREDGLAVFGFGEKKTTAPYVAACDRFYRRHGIRVERVLTDNGTCFKKRWRERCDELEIGVRKTRPYRPQTNGKAERLIRTLLERWAYAYSVPGAKEDFIAQNAPPEAGGHEPEPEARPREAVA